MADLDWLGWAGDEFRASYQWLDTPYEDQLPPTPPGTPTAQDAMPPAGQRARGWTWTRNNPPMTPDDLLTTFREDARIRYAVFQREVGENGTPHYQGYFEFHQPVTLTAVTRLVPGAHFEKRRGTMQQAADYCKKDDTRADGESGPWEHGEIPEEFAPGARTDLRELKEAIFSGKTKRQILDEYTDAVAKFPRFIDLCFREAVNDSVEKVTLDNPYPWQQQVLDMVSGEPTDREILWVFDSSGNTGKTHLATYLVDHHNAFYCNGGKGVDIVYGYQAQPVVCFDYTRDTQDYVNYSVIEQVKNGILFSSKYESGMKRFKKPHVIIFANFTPDRSKLSADRWVIVQINPDKTCQLI